MYEKFDINKYIDSKISCEFKLEERKESFRKQVVNLLKLFEPDSKHVLRYFPIYSFHQTEIENILDHLFGLKYEVTDKVVAQLNKVSVDNNLDFLKIENNSFSQSDIFLRKKIENRNIIRNVGNFNEIYKSNKIIKEFCLSQENCFHFVSEYIEFATDGILQLINYWIVTNPIMKNHEKDIYIDNLKIRIEKNNKILDRDIQDMKKMLYRNSCGLTPILAMDNFYEFLTKRNYYYEYINILEKLKEEETDEPDLFNIVEKEYEAPKTSYDDKNLKQILTEGKKVDKYNDKLRETKEMIEIFSKYGFRKVDKNCLQDLKVYFREIFISKSKYKIQARTIIRDYFNELKILNNVNDLNELDEDRSIKPFSKESEYMFVREKISRGHFREINLLEYYHMKNNLQEEIYKSFLRVYSFYDYEKSINVIYSLNSKILEQFSRIFE